ncbi:MAG: hypothetical protein PHY43_11835 [Verrucomicrobiales bacterium]|nr:hypothetical protein [Verrucomicrobiales bacterium]
MKILNCLPRLKILKSAPLRCLFATVALSFSFGVSDADAITVSTPASGLSVRVDETTGAYEVASTNPAWTFGGSFKIALTNVNVSRGSDAVGAYQQISFAWPTEQTLMTGQVRLYDENGLMLFSQTCTAAATLPPEPFPDFTNLPANLHIYSHSLREFAPPQFKANEISTPWLLFDDQANAMLISPASHFMVASMWGDGRQRVASGFNPQLRDLPAGFTQQTFLTFGQGINRTWDAWGQAHLRLHGAKRPANDADVILKYLGYWTDNGAAYYYNYDFEKGYAGTLQSLVERYRKEQIPISYLQLDSWWYSKSTTGADGKAGKSKKVEKLPEGEWNRYGGTLEYLANKDLFPDGLAAFQKSIGLPLVTHGRWIDRASPYHEKYKISGIAAVGPKWWNATASYLKSSGVTTYEQDWCDRIFKFSPEFSSNLETGEAFLDNMARACKENGITMQYCMPYACYFLQGSRYENLTSIRTCTDRFNPNRWNDFLYTSRLATSMGLWPWADVYNSTEINNVLLSTLSAGPVGIGDLIGTETKTNLVRAVRTDGVIVKPDAPIVPLDQSYLADAQHSPAPLTCSTYTDHEGIKTVYVFAYNRPKTSAGEVHLNLAELGLNGPAYLFDGFTGKGRRMEAATTFSTALAQNATAFYIVAPVGKSGIAFLGDCNKFVSTGKQRIASLRDEAGKLTVKVIYAESEKSVCLHGYAPAAPRVTVQSGQARTVQYDADTRHFTVEINPGPSAPLDKSSGDPVRHLTVVLETSAK